MGEFAPVDGRNQRKFPPKIPHSCVGVGEDSAGRGSDGEGEEFPLPWKGMTDSKLEEGMSRCLLQLWKPVVDRELISSGSVTHMEKAAQWQ